MAPVLTVRGLTKRFGDTLAVDRISFEVGEGEVFGLLGPNGAGKTTTVRLLCTLVRPTAGEATVCGIDVRTGGARLRRIVGLLTEQPGLYDRLTALDNLLYFADLYGVERAEAMATIEASLRRFALWERRADRAGAFSKGMRQKLAFVRAVVHAPQVLFFDEPTSALDPEAARTVREAIAQLAREGRTVVLCTHNLDEAQKLCDRVAILCQRLVAVGRIDDLVRAESQVRIEVDGPAERWSESARAWSGATRVWAADGLLTVSLASVDGIPELVALLAARGARIRSVVPERRGLEEAYLELVRGADGAESSVRPLRFNR